MIKGFVVVQEMPEPHDTLYYEIGMIWGAPLRFTMS